MGIFRRPDGTQFIYPRDTKKEALEKLRCEEYVLLDNLKTVRRIIKDIEESELVED